MQSGNSRGVVAQFIGGLAGLKFVAQRLAVARKLFISCSIIEIVKCFDEICMSILEVAICKAFHSSVT